MKRLNIRHSILALFALLSMFSVTSNAEPITLEPRKIARQSGPTSNSGNPSAHKNSLSSSQDGNGKPLPTQQTGYQAQQSYSRPNGLGSSQESQMANNNAIAQPQSTVYSHIQSSSSLGTTNQPAIPSGGYILSVNTQSGQPTALTQAPTPVLMQYLPQQQPANGVQYLQLIPTRPLIVPISPYISEPTIQTNSGLQQQYGQVGGQNYANAQNYVTAGQNYASSGRYLSGSQPAGQYPTYHATGAVGSYGSPSAPIISFFRPHTGIQLINGPVDMSLNTNEYIPIQGESAFKMRRA